MNLHPNIQQPSTQTRTEKPTAARHKDSFSKPPLNMCHRSNTFTERGLRYLAACTATRHLRAHHHRRERLFLRGSVSSPFLSDSLAWSFPYTLHQHEVLHDGRQHHPH